MGAAKLEEAPVLSTPDAQLLTASLTASNVETHDKISDEELLIRYEIKRTVKEIRSGRWRRIALQFPDHMLVDAPRVYHSLSQALRGARKAAPSNHLPSNSLSGTEEDLGSASARFGNIKISDHDSPQEKLFILADTSYGSCCVDEIAAEHMDADVVVHYGRSCLSPTARLPVIYVFTTNPLNLEHVCDVFRKTYPDRHEKVILMADIPYSSYVSEVALRLEELGYDNLFSTSIIHDPSSSLPNRTVPKEVVEDMEKLRDYELFHISEPPTSLLLTLSSRVKGVNIYNVKPGSNSPGTSSVVSTAAALRRRYALVASLSSASVFGILVNTLSVKNYLHVVDHVRAQIAAAGKKSYSFVVGKLNAAKVANFSEIDGWVIIGCWESSLIESKDFWKPIITPFELNLSLKGDASRVWTGEWTSDFQAVLRPAHDREDGAAAGKDNEQSDMNTHDSDFGSEEESQPPEFDLRTGRYVSHSHPLQNGHGQPSVRSNAEASDTGVWSVAKRPDVELARIGGVVSPGAEFLRSQRTWQGLGSDFVGSESQAGAENGRRSQIEEGRSGIASGYSHENQSKKE